nr:response regulator [Pelagibacteraceae bacterium]
MINCIILDDEPLAIKVITNFIQKIDFLNCIGSYSNANDSMETLKKHKVDLMFLDINMPFIDGISFLKSLENPPRTIITSAHSEYAIE